MNYQRIAFLTLIIVFLVAGQQPFAAPQLLKAVPLDDKVQVFVEGKIFTEYLINPEQKYPYFYPVNGPKSGKSITTETSEPYPHHHSLFFGCDRVNGGNYWQDVNDRGQIVSEKIDIKQDQGNQVVFVNQCIWKRPGADAPIRDERTITISAPSENIRIIDFEIIVTALIDVEVQKTNHALFSARVVPELSVTQGGTLVNSIGDKSEAGTFGKEASWCDYFGTRDGITEGIAIFDHPSNPWYPSKWFTRDYGFFSPTELHWIDEPLRIPQGEAHLLRYRVIVHESSAEKAKINELFNLWIK